MPRLPPPQHPDPQPQYSIPQLGQTIQSYPQLSLASPQTQSQSFQPSLQMSMQQPNVQVLCQIRKICHASAGEETAVLAAVVVTIRDGCSYDMMFEQIPQQGPEGTRVDTFVVSPESLAGLLLAMRGGPAVAAEGEDFRELLASINAVDPASVVFNWECCSGCSGEQFRDARVVMALMQHLLDKGHMVMCSDFSLKALIKQWSEPHLGPNPFVKIGEFSGQFFLHFDARELQACSSAQLAKVGELSEDGRVQVHAMGGTLAFTVDWRQARTDCYNLDVLTVASGMQCVSLDLPEHRLCTAGGRTGAAGHVLLKYPSGGSLLASSGHWIELAQIKVSEDQLLHVATSSYGAAYSGQVQQQMATLSGAARREYVQSVSSMMVQQSAPCSYSATRTA